MTEKEAFTIFLENIKVSSERADKVRNRYNEITKKLNKTFRDTDSETANSLRVGSYGRYTGIKGISDLDMLYIMPNSLWETYEDKPGNLLSDVKEALRDRYPKTKMRKDNLVVVVDFSDFKIEVQPVFEFLDDGEKVVSYKYPTTKDGGAYKVTKPRHEQQAMIDFKQNHGAHHRLLCKMLRAWKDNVGLPMGGLLIDTLAYRFCTSHPEFDKCGYASFGRLTTEFFEYLKDEPKQDFYLALGSKQRVKVKSAFQSKAKQAYKECNKALEETSEETKHTHWLNVFGNSFPKGNTLSESRSFSDTEEFIEDTYPIDIRHNLSINCTVTRDGFPPQLLRDILNQAKKVLRVRHLEFYIEFTNVPKPYKVKWKVLNIGAEAESRNCVRGQIITSNKVSNKRTESAVFFGDHYVECYIIKDNIVVARDKISVPISHDK